MDLEVHIRSPQQYLKTRVYSEGLVEEAVYILAEWLATASVQGSVSFPEVVVPIVVALRKGVKGAKSGFGANKEAGLVKGLVERVEDSARWVEQRRKELTFGPERMKEVEAWEMDLRLKVEESPLGKYVKVQRKAREKRRMLVEKVCAMLLF